MHTIARSTHTIALIAIKRVFTVRDGGQRRSTRHACRILFPMVAVLIDQRVGSAGDAVAVAFKQRANTRFFDTATCGASTANMDFRLSDGALLYLACRSWPTERGRCMVGRCSLTK